jgi:hypothetical protein
MIKILIAISLMMACAVVGIGIISERAAISRNGIKAEGKSQKGKIKKSDRSARKGH